ncbi:23S rRNA (cytidine1920-2'-O)/16S rRNA (cytidine1409-2'-O)-methyltransferase [Rhodoferax ferrireducens]|uniref:23S rRNA (Cytidine1920-2'-O)/16S rRNA (Cytidine1409-2'-O)-methyltransferase n=1 Tax=Rhodoferax ferrireducens TaxID=192843 RepID=A0ABU2CCI0_9BURK|nr:TlyA family RNA methyltransferase [Rhodoferax ferrireducens]MDR7379036.1 23S rRNA (cytidine1920-2'-O)/16S rRNA (cytidine1409-2'-O)-methyltransferase [Rhodoferax ferrireducens]
MRADQLLVERGLAASRSQAVRLITGGMRWFDGIKWRDVAKNKDDIPTDAKIELLDDAEARYVSRGGLKLEAALKHLGLDVTDCKVLDVGQSTGGFTDCLLQAGAAQVTGVDVGHGQLHPKLRSDLRVLCVEGLNARSLTPESLQEACEMVLSEHWEPPAVDDPEPEAPYSWMRGGGEVTDYDDSDDADDAEVEAHIAQATGKVNARPLEADPAAEGAAVHQRPNRRKPGLDGVDTDPEFDLVTGDVSFISLTLILPALVPLLNPDSRLLMLVKPQFELQPGQVGKGGIVRDEALYGVVEARLRQCCAELGLEVLDWFDSAVVGGDGNREYFIFAKTSGA